MLYTFITGYYSRSVLLNRLFMSDKGRKRIPKIGTRQKKLIDIWKTSKERDIFISEDHQIVFLAF